MTPSMTSVYGYWNASDGNLFDSYRDYVRETGLAKYNADVVGKYIATASAEHVEAIGRLGQAMGRGMNVLSDQMSDISNQLGFLNKNLDLQIENQKLSNLLLQNISEISNVSTN